MDGNVRPLTEAAEIGAEYFLPRYNFLGLDKRARQEKPAVSVNGGWEKLLR